MPIMGKGDNMSLQIRTYGNFSNLQSSIKPYDWVRKMNALTDDMILHVATEIFTQFPHNSEEVYYMGIELSRRGLGGKIKELKKLN